jgi:hypothetical protein
MEVKECYVRGPHVVFHSPLIQIGALPSWSSQNTARAQHRQGVMTKTVKVTVECERECVLSCVGIRWTLQFFVITLKKTPRNEHRRQVEKRYIHVDNVFFRVEERIDYTFECGSYGAPGWRSPPTPQICRTRATGELFHSSL